MTACGKPNFGHFCTDSRLGDSPGSVRVRTGAIAQTADRMTSQKIAHAATVLYYDICH